MKTLIITWIVFIFVWIASFILGYGILFSFYDDRGIEYPEFLEAVPVFITALFFVVAVVVTGLIIYRSKMK